MSTSSSGIVAKDDTTKEVLEPSVRMRQLVEMSHNISVDKEISISKYFHSGKELLKSASALELKGDIETAFVLYLRYMTLFVEKLIHHPEYNKADKAEKQLVRNECNRVFDLAESLKKRLREQYTKEYEEYKLKSGNITQGDDRIQKRSMQEQNTAPNESGVDEIDRKFDFSQKSVDVQPDRGFDPFNIEELKQSFNNQS